MRTILHTVDIAAPRRQIYEAILTPEGLSGWWSTTVTADYLEPGGVVDFTFAEGFHPDMRIEATQEHQLVEWRCIAGHEPWHDNTFRFELADLDDERTRLRFRQHYATELDDDAYGTYNFNWAYYLQSLKELVETGTGRPFQPEAAAGG